MMCNNEYSRQEVVNDGGEWARWRSNRKHPRFMRRREVDYCILSQGGHPENELFTLK